MQLLDELRSEHALIEKVVGSLRTYARQPGPDPGDGRAFLGFFRVFSGGFHHAREEDTLFPALVSETELPSDRGPVAAFLEQHHEMAVTLGEMEPLLLSPQLPPEGQSRLVALADRYAEALWQHIDAENTVLIPESEERLSRAGHLDLPSRPMTGAEAAAEAEGRRLVAAYPPTEADAIRGEGCVICPSYGGTCQGVEKEWWNENEWDEFSDHLG